MSVPAAALIAPSLGMPGCEPAAPGRRETADLLVTALRGEQFVLFAQPIEPAGAAPAPPACQEILVRFLEEEDKLLPPGSFIPLLESLRLMSYVDRWVVNRTARWVRAQPRSQVRQNAINLSTESLLDDGFAAFVEKQVRTGGICGASLCFEIAWPTVVAHRSRVQALAAALSPLGCCLSFASYDGAPGTLDLLVSLKPDLVKISGDLIGRMDRDALDAAVVEGISRHCRRNGIRTVAEHVERPNTLDLARAIGVDYVQGFLIGHPAPLH